jgi:hypothetical protein
MRKEHFGLILKEVASKKKHEEKVEELKKHVNDGFLTTFLCYVYDTQRWKWFCDFLPKDYKILSSKIDIDFAGTHLRDIIPILYLFLNDSVIDDKKKLEKLYFILEGMHKSEIELLSGMFSMKREIKGISRKVIEEVFPSLLQKVS